MPIDFNWSAFWYLLRDMIRNRGCVALFAAGLAGALIGYKIANWRAVKAVAAAQTTLAEKAARVAVLEAANGQMQAALAAQNAAVAKLQADTVAQMQRGAAGLAKADADARALDARASALVKSGAKTCEDALSSIRAGLLIDRKGVK